MNETRSAALPPVAHDHLVALHALWLAKRGARKLPARADIEVFELKPWLGWLSLLDVVDDGADFRFRVFGTALTERFGTDWTGRHLSEQSPEAQARSFPAYRRVVASSEPDFGILDRADARARYAWQRLILPLSTGGAEVAMLLVMVRDIVFDPVPCTVPGG